MAGYGISLGLVVIGLAMYFRNCDPNFDRSLFWMRLEWMNSKNNGKFIKRIAEIYKWKGTDGRGVDKALAKLFGRCGADLEEGADGLSLTFIKSKKSKKSLKIEPET
ncbi:hypothetical protein TrLO_g4178 [Triparma laevis f. longispina]|uniref:Uncharacterized protein n=1 Tax=Triparma laevis f. longispina TaxID=1714387 RepID=A0A9W7KVV9_9STRA|nr:hypothetical protein TrLO_g4178 [Triparma laevis f. longispina]